MKTVTLTIPDSLDVDSLEVARIVATQLYEQGKLSLGEAADLVGLDKRAFIEMLGQYGVSIFNYPPSDLADDVASA
jgi:predicted HTH domain antitoxin